MRKLVTLFPTTNISELKIFEDNASTIRGHYFKRSAYKELKQFENTDSPCIYFLLHQDQSKNKCIYIGQSINGFNRIDNHNLNKGDWCEGYLFHSTNGSWSKTIIDYLEYHYIEVFKETNYVVKNTGGRVKPNLSIYDQADINFFIDGLNFLLFANDVIQPKTAINEANTQTFQNKDYEAKLMREGDLFIVLTGSEVKKSVESAKEWRDKNWYFNNNNKVEKLIDDGFIKLIDSKLIVQRNIEFKAPSPAATLVSGTAKNGWEFWNIAKRND